MTSAPRAGRLPRAYPHPRLAAGSREPSNRCLSGHVHNDMSQESATSTSGPMPDPNHAGHARSSASSRVTTQRSDLRTSVQSAGVPAALASASHAAGAMEPGPNARRPARRPCLSLARRTCPSAQATSATSTSEDQMSGYARSSRKHGRSRPIGPKRPGLDFAAADLHMRRTRRRRHGRGRPSAGPPKPRARVTQFDGLGKASYREGRIDPRRPGP